MLSARAGTPLREVEALLAQRRQRLAFEPPDHRAFYGAPGRGEPTVGAVAAANLSGPRRVQAGAARDSLIGLRAVTGEGKVVKSGGRVMKNVTGYDLVKFLSGSYGTLAVLSEVTFKVQPAPETEATLVFSGLEDARAVAALGAALGSPFGVTGAAHVGNGATYIRLDGFSASVADRATRLGVTLAAYGTPEVLRDAASEAIWKNIRDLGALDAPPASSVWRVSVRPTAGPAVVAAVRRSFPARVLYDWGGGLVFIAGGEGADAGAAVVRWAVEAAGGGHATLVRAPEAIRARIPVFEKPSAPAMALTRRLKAVFDPAGILNPGRMYEGV